MSNLFRLALTPELRQALEDRARARKLRPTDLARLALAEYLTDEAADPNRNERPRAEQAA